MVTMRRQRVGVPTMTLVMPVESTCPPPPVQTQCPAPQTHTFRPLPQATLSAMTAASKTGGLVLSLPVQLTGPAMLALSRLGAIRQKSRILSPFEWAWKTRAPRSCLMRSKSTTCKLIGGHGPCGLLTVIKNDVSG